MKIQTEQQKTTKRQKKLIYQAEVDGGFVWKYKQKNKKQLKGKQNHLPSRAKIIYQAEVQGSSGMNGESEGDVHVSSCIVASCTGE